MAKRAHRSKAVTTAHEVTVKVQPSRPVYIAVSSIMHNGVMYQPGERLELTGLPEEKVARLLDKMIVTKA